jgi:hypothetical protein
MQEVVRMVIEHEQLETSGHQAALKYVPVDPGTAPAGLELGPAAT